MLETDRELSQHLFIGHLLSARHCSESWRYNSEQKKSSSTGRAYSLLGKREYNTNKEIYSMLSSNQCNEQCNRIKSI